jgi:hypothetical protein
LFAYNNLTGVTMQDGVTSIGAGAFAYNDLTRVAMPANINFPGGGIFSRYEAENFDFLGFYAANGKKAGTYRLTGFFPRWRYSKQAAH